MTVVQNQEQAQKFMGENPPDEVPAAFTLYVLAGTIVATTAVDRTRESILLLFLISNHKTPR